MIFSAIAHIFSALPELSRISRMSDHEKDLEILVLRYQLGIADRRLNRTLKPDKSEKLTLAVLVTKLKQRTNRTTNDLRSSVRIFSPRTVIRWHNELVKRKWTYKQTNKGGRPRINKQIEKLIMRLAQENSRWGSYPANTSSRLFYPDISTKIICSQFHHIPISYHAAKRLFKYLFLPDYLM